MKRIRRSSCNLSPYPWLTGIEFLEPFLLFLGLVRPESPAEIVPFRTQQVVLPDVVWVLAVHVGSLNDPVEKKSSWVLG
jgi:hypothetical protein